jgi:hypothetical protein
MMTLARMSSWLLGSIGVALLVTGLWLVPDTLALADGGTCDGQMVCSDGCTITSQGTCPSTSNGRSTCMTSMQGCQSCVCKLDNEVCQCKQ